MLKLSVDARTGRGAELALAEVVLPEGRDTLVKDFGLHPSNLALTAQRIYATYQLGGPSEVRVFDLAGQAVKAPTQFAVGAVSDIVRAAEWVGALVTQGLERRSNA